MKRVIAGNFQRIVRDTEAQCFRSFIEELRREFGRIRNDNLNLMAVMEGWSFRSNGIDLLKADENVPGGHYEAWISVFLFRNGHILSKEGECEVPSSCVNVLKFENGKEGGLLLADDLSIQKSGNQLKEILAEWMVSPYKYQESRDDTSRLLGRARHYETVFRENGIHTGGAAAAEEGELWKEKKTYWSGTVNEPYEWDSRKIIEAEGGKRG